MHPDDPSGPVPLPGTPAYEAEYHRWLQKDYRPLVGGWQY